MRFFFIFGILTLFILADKFPGLRLLALSGFLFICALGSIKENLTALLFWVPAQRFIVINDGGATILNLLIFYIFLQMIHENRFRVSRSVVLVSLFSASFLALVAFFDHDLYPVLVYLKLVITLLVLSKVVREYNFNDKCDLILTYLAGVCAFLLLSLMLLPVGETVRDHWGSVNNPNIVGLLCAFAFSVVAVMKRFMMISIRSFMLVSLLLIFMGMLTQSRTFIISLAIPMLYLLFFYVSRINLKFFFSLFLIVIAVVSYSLLDDRLGNIFFAVMDRFTNPRGGDVSGGRLEIWRDYFTYFDANHYSIFFGSGLDRVAGGKSAHNAYIGDLASFGLFGQLFAYFTVASFLIFSYLRKLSLIALIIPLSVIIFSRMFSHSFLGLEGLTQLVVTVCLAMVVRERLRNSDSKYCRFSRLFFRVA